MYMLRLIDIEFKITHWPGNYHEKEGNKSWKRWKTLAEKLWDTDIDGDNSCFLSLEK